MMKQNQVPLSIFISPCSTNAEYFKFCHKNNPIEWRVQIPEGKKANQASHIIINIVLVFGLPKEKQTKSNFFKNYINYQIKVL